MNKDKEFWGPGSVWVHTELFMENWNKDLSNG